MLIVALLVKRSPAFYEIIKILYRMDKVSALIAVFSHMNSESLTLFL
jgi:hypothetical protein